MLPQKFVPGVSRRYGLHLSPFFAQFLPGKTEFSPVFSGLRNALILAFKGSSIDHFRTSKGRFRQKSRRARRQTCFTVICLALRFVSRCYGTRRGCVNSVVKPSFRLHYRIALRVNPSNIGIADPLFPENRSTFRKSRAGRLDRILFHGDPAHQNGRFDQQLTRVRTFRQTP
jgi:hypothetical protein